MAVSFLTGRIVYISEQAAVLLRCKRDVFRGARFSELLAPQDVGVFYGSTTPSRLPTWGAGTSTGKVPYAMQRTEQLWGAAAMSSLNLGSFPGLFSAQERDGTVLTVILICSRVRPQRLYPGKVCLLPNQVGRGSRRQAFSPIYPLSP